jgi:hypothetical protein
MDTTLARERNFDLGDAFARSTELRGGVAWRSCVAELRGTLNVCSENTELT